MKPAAMLAGWRGLHDKELREASGQQLLRNWGLSPTACKELNPANNHVSWEAELFQLRQDETMPGCLIYSEIMSMVLSH